MRDQERTRSAGSLGQWQGGATPSKAVSAYWHGGTIPWVSPKDMAEDAIRYSEDCLTVRGAERLKIYSPGDIAVVFRSGVLRHSFPVAKGLVPFTVNQDLKVLRPAPDVDSGYAFHLLRGIERRVVNEAVKSGTTVESVDSSIFHSLRVYVPPPDEQRRIAEILDTLDEAIRKTEQLITKLKQVKQGLLHDLLTCGIDDNGELRDPERHPKQFKESLLGRVPRAWESTKLSSAVTSAVDGPFGSNLKTEHYVPEPGVRIIRLQNIGLGEFIDADKAWVSCEHAAQIDRHDARPGDVLVASLGDENHPFARACLFPKNHAPGIVKADCFRLRCDLRLTVPGFVMLALNEPRWRTRLRGLAQGVTRDRVNLGNLLRLDIPVPPLAEQDIIVARAKSITDRLTHEQRSVEKLRLLKQGLMEDLLTGRVPVTPHLSEPGP